MPSLSNVCFTGRCERSTMRMISSFSDAGVLSVGWQLVSAWRNSGETQLNLCRKDLPLCQCGRAAGFVGFSVDEMAFGIEMVVKRGMDGSEFLQ